MTRVHRERIISVLSPLILIAVWEVAARAGWLDRRIIPPPTEVVATIYDLTVNESLAEQTATPSCASWSAFWSGSCPVCSFGLTMGLFSLARAVLNPLVSAIYPVPRIALFPLVLILVGLNETSNILMVALGPFFTMIITAMGAVTSVDPIYREVAKNFDAKPRHLYFQVTLPAIAPALMDGLRISVGLALLGAISVEFLVADNGLGHLIWNSWQLLSLKQSMAGLVVAAVLGFVAYGSLNLVELYLIPWQRRTAFQ